ncbi:anti-anti-sigma regulatory factor [Actinoplanes tereljensis]|uniref:Anti-anti-sigma factor n=1 Tax=Paractinoplanes tereljensis TaxID=571912 RepID=A0A919TXX2_9ACTN|nr:STAS domain-containing protein [Actinoplanes tereljensis]GIF24650.1 anti-anti-sigma factor [Actinoplanes tereljensis]
MSSEVRPQVDGAGPFPLVRLAGVLDAGSAPSLRSALLEVLAGQPEAVVVDVGDLEVRDRDAVEVLRDLYRDTADWPAARLVLCGPGDPTVWQAAEWPVLADRDKAFAQLGPPSADRRISVGMEPQVGAARRSRELINEACARWGREEVAGSACIVVTEMVNNVVQHAHTSMIVLLAPHDGGGLSVAVRDHSGTVPSYTGAPAPTSYGGRGMLLIDSVASRWGSLALSDGKVVWALLAGSMTDPIRG